MATATGVFVALLLGLAFAVIGPTESHDSFTYLDLAQDLVDGRGFADPTFDDATHFPPITSVLVAGISRSGMSLTNSFGLVNTLAWAAAVIAAARLFRQAGGRDPVACLLLLLWVGAGGASAAIFSSALSEGLFIALCLWAVVVAERWVTRPTLLLAAITWVLCALATGTRYVGVALVIAISVRVLLQPGRRRRIAAALLPLSSVVPLALWWMAHHSKAGDGPATIADRTFGPGTVLHSLAALGSWPVGLPYNESGKLLSPSVDPLVRGAAGALAVGILLGLAWWLRKASVRHGGVTGLVAVARDRSWLTAVLATALSVGLLVAWRFLIGYHVLVRYWTPALLPGAVIAAAAASLHLQGASTATRRWVLAAAVLFLLANALFTVRYLVG